MAAVLGVDAGSATLPDAEHLLLGLAARLGAAPGAVLCTHLVRSADAHYAVSLELPAPPAAADLAAAVPADAGHAVATGHPAAPDGSAPRGSGGPGPRAAAAAAVAGEHAARRSGRAVRFAGVELLTGRLPVAEVLARTAVEEVRVIAGGSADGADLLTLDFVRPEWRDGRLVLLAQPAGPGLVAPFELADQKPCCVAHGSSSAARVSG